MLYYALMIITNRINWFYWFFSPPKFYSKSWKWHSVSGYQLFLCLNQRQESKVLRLELTYSLKLCVGALMLCTVTIMFKDFLLYHNLWKVCKQTDEASQINFSNFQKIISRKIKNGCNPRLFRDLVSTNIYLL